MADISFANLIISETPPGLVIPVNYIANKSVEYRTIFKLYPNTAIDLSLVDDDVTWPQLYNMLIAKLVIHDYLLKGLQATLVQGSGDAAGNTVGIKSIETGPTKVEFMDRTRALSDFMKSSGGISALDSLRTDICGMASAMGLQLHICRNRNMPIVPQKQGLPENPTEETLLNKYYS